MRTLLAALAIIASLAASAHAADLDWDHYQTKQDACLEKDRMETACSRGWCDPLALRRAIHACSAFGPRGEREPSP